jgi:geranylgeranyl pyrophosphate synthase
MKKSSMKHEEPLEQVKKMIEKEGIEGWNLAKQTLLDQETRTSQLKEAINYITQLPDFFRPAVVLLCSSAVGGNPEATVPCGASLILLSKAIGIHDDIIDDLKMRNKRPTFFGKFGKEMSLILSDILLFKGFTLMRRNFEIGVPQQSIVEILETIHRVWFEQAESEVMELRSRKQFDVSPRTCLAKIEMRASEFEAIARIGGILGGGSHAEIEALGTYGRLLGTSSLLRDELIDMLEFDTLRRRIKSESLPLPLVYALQNTRTRSKIISLISKRKLTRSDLRRISVAADKAGGLDYTGEQIAKMTRKARSSIKTFKNRELLELLSTSLCIDREEWQQALYSK